MVNGSLTVAALMAAASMLPPPPPRIIVGMPTVGENMVLESQEEPRVILMGTRAYEKLRDYAKPLDPATDPFFLTFGIPIEFWGDHQDHVLLFAQLRVAIQDATAAPLEVQ